MEFIKLLFNVWINKVFWRDACCTIVTWSMVKLTHVHIYNNGKNIRLVWWPHTIDIILAQINADNMYIYGVQNRSSLFSSTQTFNIYILGFDVSQKIYKCEKDQHTLDSCLWLHSGQMATFNRVHKFAAREDIMAHNICNRTTNP